MAVEKYQTQYVSTAANTTSSTDISTFDDFRTRTLTGIYLSTSTAQIHIQVQLAGKTIADIDTSIFSNTYGMYAVNIPYPSGILIHVNIVNGTGSAANNVAVVLRYEVDSV